MVGGGRCGARRPDGIDSPTFLKQNFDVLEAVQLYQEAQLSPVEELFEMNSPYPDGINQLALRISTYEYPLGSLLAIYFLSVTGHMTPKFCLDHWIKAAQWHGDSKVAAVVNTMEEWVDAEKLLTPLENVVVEAESTQGTVVWSSTQKDHPAIPEGSLPLKLVVRPEHDIQRRLPPTLHVEATGLGGRDLTHPIPWDISIRSDKEGQSVYGPSLAPLEETVFVSNNCGGTETLQISALGRSKAAHEFLVLHYYALDSAKHWDEVLLHVVPTVRLPGAKARRAAALEAFGASHIPPSHRRMPHVLWTDAMTLIWNLLIGGRMGRYTGSPAEAFRRAVLLVLVTLIFRGSGSSVSTRPGDFLLNRCYGIHPICCWGRTLYKVSGSGRMESWKSSLAMFLFVSLQCSLSTSMWVSSRGSLPRLYLQEPLH